MSATPNTTTAFVAACIHATYLQQRAAETDAMGTRALGAVAAQIRNELQTIQANAESIGPLDERAAVSDILAAVARLTALAEAMGGK